MNKLLKITTVLSLVAALTIQPLSAFAALTTAKKADISAVTLKSNVVSVTVAPSKKVLKQFQLELSSTGSKTKYTVNIKTPVKITANKKATVKLNLLTNKSTKDSIQKAFFAKYKTKKDQDAIKTALMKIAMYEKLGKPTKEHTLKVSKIS